MKTIKLLKNHEQDGKFYLAGESIEVTDTIYQWLMDIYLVERKELVAKLNSIKVLGDAK